MKNDAYTPVRSVGLEIAEGHLKEALRYTKANGAPKTTARIRLAISSIKGAIRNADAESYRVARREGN